MRRTAPTTMGVACAKCGERERYVSSRGCVKCSRASPGKPYKKNGRTGASAGMPLPAKPNIKGLPPGVDPICFLGLGGKGKFK